MNYQSIRAKIEAPLLTAYNTQIPPIPVYFDNVSAMPPSPPKEYVRINVAFGLTTEAMLTRTLDHARGVLILRCFTSKSNGPARCQEMIAIAKNVIDVLNATGKAPDTTFVRVGPINGPAFYAPEDSPHFVGEIKAGWQAMAR